MSEVSIQQTIVGTGNYVVGQGTLNIIQQLPELDREGHRNLAILRDKVKQFWIGGVLEKSVHGEALIALGRQSMVEAVDHPWASTLELPDRESQLLPSGKKNSEIFYECGRALLILGEPGSGKTVSLLELARDLIQKSEMDPTQPVPVIFNLSSWGARRLSLFDWLVEELKAKYFVSRKLAELWLQQNRLLILLDGLDEVVGEARGAGVEAIHKHLEEQGSSGIVVCCRIRDYNALPLKLKLNAAICVQPLTAGQIDQYLQRSGERLAALRQAVNDDSVLGELAQTPLMLSIMSLAYQDVMSAQLKLDGLKTFEERREHIFEQYVEKMFLRRAQTGPVFKKETTMNWLAGLARQMTQRAQTVFIVEGLQPDWLPRRLDRWHYFIISRGVSGVLLVAFLLGAFLPAVGSDPPSGRDIFESAIILIIFFAVMGISVGLVEAFLLLRTKSRDHSLWRAIIKRFHIYGLLSAVSVVVVCRAQEAHFWKIRVVEWVLALLAATVFGALFGIVFGARANRERSKLDIETVESLTWSWRQSVRGLWRGFIVGCLVCPPVFFSIGWMLSDMIRGIVAGIIPVSQYNPNSASNAVTESLSGAVTNSVTMPETANITSLGASASESPKSSFLEFLSNSSEVLLSALVGGLICSVFGFFFFGLVRGVASTKTSANQGILLSFRTAFRAGAPAGLFFGIVIWAVANTSRTSENLAWTKQWGSVLICGSVSGLFLGSAIALWYGGFDIIQHYTLRLLLWRRSYVPRRLVRFLDHASDLILLQKVGGGYIFIHRLLLEHFAAMESKWSAQPPTSKP